MPLHPNEVDIDALFSRDAQSASLSAEPAPAVAATRFAAEVLDAVDPATRQLIAHVFATAPTRIPAILARAHEAARPWIDLPAPPRTDALARLRRLVALRAHEIAETIARGMGKPLIEALSFEVAPVLETLDLCIAHAADRADDEAAVLPAPLRRYEEVLQPHADGSVVCVIAPVSSPFELAMTPAVLALAAGNAVIVKPSSSAPLVGVLIERLFDETFAGYPGL